MENIPMTSTYFFNYMKILIDLFISTVKYKNSNQLVAINYGATINQAM